MNPSLEEMIDVGCRLARRWQHVPGFAVGSAEGLSIGECLIGVGGSSLDAARKISAIPDAADRR